MRYIDPVAEFGGLLLKVQKPGRYVGGEVGILSNKPEKKDAVLRTAIAFPDLYEVGMVNQALRIIYNRMNSLQDISCDRAFAPAPDFEKLLRENNIPLYGLDTGISLFFLDILMFTLGYELGLNGILLMLDVSGIPLRCDQRSDEHPVVIAGGPAVSNPLPYSPFIDAFWIGEAEGGFFDLALELATIKKRGEGRAALLDKIASHPNVWVRGKAKAKRAIYSGFSSDKDTASHVFPVPSMKIIHHHGTVEIMRGCPNGCRFCHAGYWYRPMRQKSREQIVSEVEEMVTKGGWQRISLSSLSSGDYEGVTELIEELNSRFSSMNVSFQMPSLKVSGFSLDLLEKISVTRKSGLTFAVETPLDVWQMAINKEVTQDSVIKILEEAKKRGWKSAKFYFMIGLPLPESEKSEEEEIVDFITDIGRRTRMCFNINVGVFIPKPHTPYQWVSQIDNDAATKKLNFIRSKLKPLGHKVSVSDLLISRIEGLLSRGDERAGILCEKAFLAGSRLDAWDEYINKELWNEILQENRSLIDGFFKISQSFTVSSCVDNNIKTVQSPNCKSGKLPWDMIDSCITDDFLNKEFVKSNNCQKTDNCNIKCSSCGVCNNDIKPVKNTPATVNREYFKVNKCYHNKSDPSIYRLLFSFSKNGSSVFYGHLSLIEIFSMSFRRAGIPVIFTKGFNPLVKMEFASPLSIGISADCEYVSVDFLELFNTDFFKQQLNKTLPQGINILNAEIFHIPGGIKKHSLSSLLWGFKYSSICNEIDYVNVKFEKVYRQNRLEKDCASVFNLRRNEVLAKNIKGKNPEWASYFDVYRQLYHL